MTEYTVEKDVPAPPSERNKYPFNRMEVGDSFFVPEDSVSEHIFRSAASVYAKRRKVRFTVRKTEGGLRVWRIA